jgi:hypothetical protein
MPLHCSRSTSAPRPTHAISPTPQSCVISCFKSAAFFRPRQNALHIALTGFRLNYIAHNNENPKPLVWTKGPEKLQRIIEAAKGYQTVHPRKPRKRRKSRNK